MKRTKVVTVPPDEAPLGLRERGKRERLRRIKEAAFEVFRAEGYEKASTREIARLADVSIGTLFVYAKDKRDLLFLVLNEDLDRILEESVSSVPNKGETVDRIAALLTPTYKYFAREPELARHIVGQSGRADTSILVEEEHTLRYRARLDRWRQAIAAILEDANRQGILEIGREAKTLARALFAVHLAEVRDWLTTARAPDPATGIEQMLKAVRAIIEPRTKRLGRRGKKKSLV
ncbi:TetR/AcrR family transcriptional regulator [Bradyrhizobium jicamae]|uniref:TetR/AcrR family transcriptional regulator n=1 Tax=Bradyrhizobium jicamae TaxID=280332 RepID=UPI001BAACB53|nr:TetR/AcrR family transcriptional regulator [Bradyrhizobium jicamae]MBR0755293.1 TetR/AcrR family transcriptional regulator [Bradyrhizobium jicamae]